MIVRYVEDKRLGDLEVVAWEIRDKVGRMYAPETIRKRCTVATVDEETGRQLYDMDDAYAALEGVIARSPHRRRQRKLTDDRL